MNPRLGEDKCSSCGVLIMAWGDLRLVGYQETEDLPLELRNCGACQSTLSRACSWRHVVTMLLELIESVEAPSQRRAMRSAAEIVAGLALPGIAALSSRTPDETSAFLCAHGKTLRERCPGCERESWKAGGKPAGRRAT